MSSTAGAAPVRVAFGLGSNLGDRHAHLAAAIAGLRRLGEQVTVSSYYESAPVGGPQQADYLNAVVVLETRLSAPDLLAATQALEAERSRERAERWGPRTLDIDILLYGDQSFVEDDLVVPHPRLLERRFALEPLLEVWPDAALPDGEPLRGYLVRVADQPVRHVEPTGPMPAWAAPLVFLAVGLAAVVIWWLGDWLL